MERDSKNYDEIRGREQQLIEFYGGIGSKRVGNDIRGVAKWNPSGRRFHNKSNEEFGQLAPYTGYKNTTCFKLYQLFFSPSLNSLFFWRIRQKHVTLHPL